MFPSCRHQKRFFDDAHRYKLYSPAGFVKQDSAPVETANSH
jgi:hypothetical protein